MSTRCCRCAAFDGADTGDAVWVDASAVPFPIHGAAFYDRLGARLGVEREADGVFVERPFDRTLVVYGVPVSGAEDVDPPPAFAATTLVDGGVGTPAVGGELSVLVRSDAAASAGAGPGGTVVALGDLRIRAGGDRFDLEPAACVVSLDDLNWADSRWHRVSVRLGIDESSFAVDGDDVDVEGLVAVLDGVVDVAPNFTGAASAARLSRAARSVGAADLELASRNGDVVTRAPRVLAHGPAAHTEVVAVDSVLVIVTRSGGVPEVAGLGLDFAALPRAVPGVDVFVAEGTPAPAQPLTLTGIDDTGAALLVQVAHSVAPRAVVGGAATALSWRNVPAGALVLTLAAGQGAVQDALPVVPATQARGLAVGVVRPLEEVVELGVTLSVTDGVGALVLAPR